MLSAANTSDLLLIEGIGEGFDLRFLLRIYMTKVPATTTATTATPTIWLYFLFYKKRRLTPGDLAKLFMLNSAIDFWLRGRRIRVLFVLNPSSVRRNTKPLNLLLLKIHILSRLITSPQMGKGYSLVSYFLANKLKITHLGLNVRQIKNKVLYNLGKYLWVNNTDQKDRQTPHKAEVVQQEKQKLPIVRGRNKPTTIVRDKTKPIIQRSKTILYASKLNYNA